MEYNRRAPEYNRPALVQGGYIPFSLWRFLKATCAEKFPLTSMGG